MKRIQATINGQLVVGYAQKIKGDLWVHFYGKTIKLPSVDVPYSKKNRNKSEGKSSSDRIIAPMPGKITKILVNLDQKITAGETVLVMEAMKMEYTLKSDINALVSKINAQLGEQVQLGAELVHLTPLVEANPFETIKPNIKSKDILRD